MNLTKLALLISFSLVAFACNTQLEEVSADQTVTTDSANASDGAGQCVVPASVDYECPGGECPDRTGCNWCSCSPAFGGSFSCNKALCPAPSDGCDADGDCAGGKVCRFRGGCDAKRGECVEATANVYHDCKYTAATAITACLCDGTSRQLQLDCNGFREPFKSLGACE